MVPFPGRPGEGVLSQPWAGPTSLTPRHIAKSVREVTSRRPAPATVDSHGDSGWGEAVWLRGRPWAQGPSPGSSLCTTRTSPQGTGLGLALGTVLSRLLCPQSGPRRNPRSRDFPWQETAGRLRSRNSRRNSGLDYPGGPNLIAGMFKNGASSERSSQLWSEGDVTGEGQSAGTASSGGGGGAASGSGGGRSTSPPSGLRRERNCEIVALRGLSHRSRGEV